MCLNCGCGEPETRHKETDITAEDVRKASADSSMDQTVKNMRASLDKIDSTAGRRITSIRRPFFSIPVIGLYPPLPEIPAPLAFACFRGLTRNRASVESRMPAAPSNRLSAIRRWAPTGLAALFIGSGALHLLRPRLFAPAMPTALPAPSVIILVSGIAELFCAGGLLAGKRWAGAISAVLLVAIFPANVTMAFATAADPASSPRARFAAWARLPLQVPFVWAALQARSPDSGAVRSRWNRVEVVKFLDADLRESRRTLRRVPGGRGAC